MKEVIELTSCEANIYETFINDSIHRNEDVFSLLSLISNIDRNYTIAIDSSWGGGKTFFVKQCLMILDAHSQNEHSLYKEFFGKIREKCTEKKIPDSTVGVYYDAWANDSDEDPFLSILLSIIESHKIDVPNTPDWISLLDGITQSFSRIKVKQLIEAGKGEDIFKQMRASRDLRQIWNRILDQLLEKVNADRIVLFIDELDRCRPIFAIKLLERIKHYFDDDKITCVYAINALELQHSIKHCYGQDFNASSYLNRFFNTKFTLPNIKSNFYLTVNGYDSRTLNYFMIDLVSAYFKFSLRDMAQFIEKVNIIHNDYKHFKNKTSSNSSELLFTCLLFPFLIGLKIHSISKYNSFINGYESKDWDQFIERYADNSNLVCILQQFNFSHLPMNMKSFAYNIFSILFKPNSKLGLKPQDNRLNLSMSDLLSRDWILKKI